MLRKLGLALLRGHGAILPASTTLAFAPDIAPWGRTWIMGHLVIRRCIRHLCIRRGWSVETPPPRQGLTFPAKARRPHSTTPGGGGLCRESKETPQAGGLISPPQQGVVSVAKARRPPRQGASFQPPPPCNPPPPLQKQREPQGRGPHSTTRARGGLCDLRRGCPLYRPCHIQSATSVDRHT